MMKFALSFVLGLFAFAGCATTSYHKVGNSTPEGEVKIEFGAKDGVHVGDKVNVYENKCNNSSKGGNRCKITLVGTMTLSKVENEVSFAKPNDGLLLKEGFVFKLEKHCENNPKECSQD